MEKIILVPNFNLKKVVYYFLIKKVIFAKCKRLCFIATMRDKNALHLTVKAGFATIVLVVSFINKMVNNATVRLQQWIYSINEVFISFTFIEFMIRSV